MKKNILLLLSLLFLFSSCSRLITIKFPEESTEIIPLKENEYYRDVKSVYVKTLNQVVLSAKDMVSDLSVLVNMTERAFQKNNFELKPLQEQADLIIEFIGINKNCDYSTNIVYKKNGKAKKLDCDLKFCGYRIYMKVTNKNNQIINYTFYQTPCTQSGCTYKLGYDCELYSPNVKNKRLRSNKKGYVSVAKDVALTSELWGEIIANHIIEEISN